MNGATTSQPVRKPRLHFSLRVLLILTAVAAMLTAAGVRFYREYVGDPRPLLFSQAVERGNLAEVDRLLSIDPSLAEGRSHGSTHSSHTPLQKAIVFGNNPQVTDRILQERPDLDETSQRGETALYLAVQHNKPAEVQRLIHLGAKVDTADKHGVTPLHRAARSRGNSQIVLWLLEAGADPNTFDNFGASPLQDAARWDEGGQIVKLLLDAGVDPDRVDTGRSRDAQPYPSHLQGQSALQVAARYGNTATVRNLLDAGADVNRRNPVGLTALHFAVNGDHFDLATLLIERGADLTARDDAGQIPGELGNGWNSEIAARIWWHEMVRLFDQHKIDRLDEMLEAAPQVLSFRTGYSPESILHQAISDKRLDLLDYLLARGADVEMSGEDGKTPLHAACWSSVPVEVAERLLDAGANIEAADRDGRTPLHWAAIYHHHDLLRTLIARGADVHARDDAGTTVLDAPLTHSFHESTGHQTLEILSDAGHRPTVLYAAATGDVELLRRLARNDAGALNRGYTNNGVRPLHAAVLGRQPEVVKWLAGQGVDGNPFTPTQASSLSPVDTPLMTALSQNMVDMTILLIDLGADVNFPGRSGYHPAHAAIAWDRDPAILEALLAHGADPALHYQEKTAFELAAESKSKHRERYLELLANFRFVE